MASDLCPPEVGLTHTLSRWILKQLCNAGLKVNVDKINILRTYLNTWKYLQVNDPRVTRRRHNCNLTAPTGVITRHFHGMVEHYCDHWARRNDAHHSHLKCGQTKVTKSKEPKCILLWYKVYQRVFNHVKTPITRVLAYPDYSKVFESYTDTFSN